MYMICMQSVILGVIETLCKGYVLAPDSTRLGHLAIESLHAGHSLPPHSASPSLNAPEPFKLQATPCRLTTLECSQILTTHAIR